MATKLATVDELATFGRVELTGKDAAKLPQNGRPIHLDRLDANPCNAVLTTPAERAGGRFDPTRATPHPVSRVPDISAPGLFAIESG